MRKKDELTSGCMAKARDDEMTFVLLGRDAAAPAAIRAWILERMRLGKNQPEDDQLTEAEECARTMEKERAEVALKSVGVERSEAQDIIDELVRICVEHGLDFDPVADRDIIIECWKQYGYQCELTETDPFMELRESEDETFAIIMSHYDQVRSGLRGAGLEDASP